MVGNLAVELPKAIHQIISELRNGCYRLCGAARRRDAARKGSVRVGIVPDSNRDRRKTDRARKPRLRWGDLVGGRLVRNQ